MVINLVNTNTAKPILASVFKDKYIISAIVPLTGITSDLMSDGKVLLANYSVLLLRGSHNYSLIDDDRRNLCK